MSKQTEIQKKWEARINKAKIRHKDWSTQFQVELARQYYAGKQNPGYPADEWITINKIYSHLMAQLPTLYNVDPYFYIKVKKTFTVDPKEVQDFERRAKVRQAMLNYLKGELDLKSKARLGIQDAHFAYGVLKVRYAADEQENPDKGKTILSESVDDEGAQLPLTTNDGSPLLEPDFIPVNERYEISRVHPDDFVWDEDAGPLGEKWGFVAERIRMTRAEAKKDKRFNRRVIKSLTAKSKESDKEERGKSSLFSSFFGSPAPEPKKEEKDDDLIITWETYDLKNKEWLVIAEDGEAPLLQTRKLPPGIEDHPYGILRFTLQDDTPYPIPPVSQAMGLQKELGLLRSKRVTHRKRFNRKYVVVTQALEDESEISKLESGDDGTVIRARNLGAIEPIKDAPLDQQESLEVIAISNDITEIFGSPGQARGIADADSATEAGILDKRLEVREGDRLSMVIDWITTIAKKLDQLVQANITRDEAVKIVGPEGEFWQEIRTQDFEAINGEFEYSVNVGAMTPQLPDTERAQWLAFMSQVVIPMPHILTAPHFMKRMARMFHIEDDAALEELKQIGLQIMSGQVPPPGGQSGGQNPNNPVTATLGTALGSLGGNANGGGASGGLQ